MSITPIQATSPDQVQAPPNAGGAGGHKGKSAQTTQTAHAANAPGKVPDFKSQIARRLQETDTTAVSDESHKKDSGAGRNQPQKPQPKPIKPQNNSTEEAPGLINIIA